MNDYKEKVKDILGEVSIDKSLTQKLGFERNIPTYVGEWLIDRFGSGGQLDDDVKARIKDFINEHLPPKSQREILRNRLLNGENLVILDDYSVYVDLKSGLRKLKIPSLDIESALVERSIVDEFDQLLCGGMWGAGKIVYHPGGEAENGEVWMVEFKPMQVGKIDVDYFCNSRGKFTLEEWRKLLINSMGYSPEAYTPSQQTLLLERLLPIVQNRINLIELSPKGTGKSWVYINLSKYIRLISGGKVTPAVIFYNNATNMPGLLVRYDLVVLDEAQTISFENPGEVIGILKGFLEAGYFTRGKTKVTSECGVLLLANIPIDSSGRPHSENYFGNLPTFFSETAFIDRLHGIVPGWEIPKFNSNMISKNLGLKGDFFGEILHSLRDRPGYLEYVKNNCSIGSDNIRDKNAIWRLAAAFLKLLFPDKQVTREEFYEYCLKPALDLRQRIRNQLSLLDSEYKSMTITVEY